MLSTPKLRWLHDLSSRPGRRRTAPARGRPALECLEDRVTPTVLFKPQFGAETVNYSVNVLDDSPGINAYLVFWGSYWQTAAGSAQAAAVESSVNAVFANSPYLDLINQYGVAHRASQPGGGLTVNAFDPNDPAQGFHPADIQAAVQYGIHAGLPGPASFANRSIYLVATPPGINSDQPNDAGYHDQFTDNQAPGGPAQTFYAWIGNGSTLVMSHEVAETMTDPVPATGVTVTPGPSFPGGRDNGHEIGDYEAVNYSSFVNGYLVQALWSAADGAYAVDDGNHQTVTVNGGDLIVNGDQLGANYDDSITVDTNAAGGVLLTLNGEVFSFGQGVVTSVTINTGGGNNTVVVRRMPSLLNGSVTINDGGFDSVTLGNPADGMKLLDCPVSITNAVGSSTNLTLDDSGNTFPRTVTVTGTYVSGLDASSNGAGVDYSHANLSALRILGGPGGDTFDVQGTQINGYTQIYTGMGNDTVNVSATGEPGASGGGLFLDNTGGSDTVDLGGGSLANVNGVVDVFGAGPTSLVVDDHADTVSHPAVTLAAGELNGLAPATIYWSGTSVALGGVTSVDVKGSTAGSNYTVTGTAGLFLGTILETGAGNDVVDVEATSAGGLLAATLTVGNDGGTDAVTVGNGGSLAGIDGGVSVGFGAGATDLYVDDSSDAAVHNATFYHGEILGLAPTDISWSASSTATGGVVVLAVYGGSGNNTYTVASTSALYYDTFLETGGGNDTVNVTGTSPTTAADFGLVIDDSGGTADVTVGNAGTVGSGGSLAGIRGAIDVRGAGGTSLRVDDSGDTTARKASLDSGSVSFTGYAAPVDFTPTTTASDGVIFLGVWLGSGGNTVTVADTPALFYYTYLQTGAGNDSVSVRKTTGDLYLNGQAGSDRVTVGNAGSVAGINGYLDVSSADGTVALTVDDSSDPAGKSMTLTGSSLTGLTPTLLNFTASELSSLAIETGAGNDSLAVASAPLMPVTFNAGGGNNSLVGPNADDTWDITGSNSGTLGNVTFLGVRNLTGGGAADVFLFGAGGSVSGTITGGGGADWLDYSARTTPVAVNLQTGTATGVNGGLAGGVSGVHNVRGSATAANTLTGDSAGGVLVGGAAADNLKAGAGRSILIGGRGADTLTGGPTDDLLIAGNTVYDANDAALMTLLTEWQSADSYTTRIAKIRSGVLPGGVRLVAGTTVLDDGAADHLIGGGGLDWFFANRPRDTITGLKPGEQVN
jgi:acrosin